MSKEDILLVIIGWVIGFCLARIRERLNRR